MLSMRDVVFAALLIAACNGQAKEIKKKASEASKRAVESYSYPVPTVGYEEGEATSKGKVIVETIKSISPSEYLTSPGYASTTLEASTTTGNVPSSSVPVSSVPVSTIPVSSVPVSSVPVSSATYDAFETDSTKKSTTVSLTSTESTTIAKKKSGYRHYTGGSTATQKQTTASVQVSSTNQPASARTISVEPSTTLFPGYQYNSPRSGSVAGESAISPKPLRTILASRGKLGNGRYTLQKIIKKPTKIDPKHSDSKPEETGLNGYHYDVGGSLSYESKNTGSQSGTMGASYMRSSSPFYNFHVMLD